MLSYIQTAATEWGVSLDDLDAVVSAGDSRNWVSRLTITVSPVAAGVCACAPRHITMASQAATMGLPICVYILSLPNSRDITRPRKFWHHGRFSFVQ